ncbi:hypothetical protein [Rhizobium binxianense]
MRIFYRRGVLPLILGCSAFAGSAYAALETGTGYSALPKDEIAFNEYTNTTACEPVDPHYLPSFIRAPDGTIIGVGYVEIDDGTGC